MTNKKITFLQKPSRKSQDDFIDNWVSGVEDNRPPKEEKLKRTTIYLPETLRQEIKLHALQEGKTMTDIVIESLKQYLK